MRGSKIVARTCEVLNQLRANACALFRTNKVVLVQNDNTDAGLQQTTTNEDSISMHLTFKRVVIKRNGSLIRMQTRRYRRRGGIRYGRMIFLTGHGELMCRYFFVNRHCISIAYESYRPLHTTERACGTI